jgi:hypothetical protein
MRHYLFLGDHSRSIRIAGSTPILKSSNSALVDEGFSVPDQVVRLRKQIGLDYGKIDYTLHDGQVVILDVNRTPGSPVTAARTVSDLADGIWSLVQRREG